MTKIIELKRIACDGSRPTMGVLIHNDMPFAVTLERPWQQNARGISCIPLGEYTCLRCNNSPDYGYKDSPKFGDTFQVMNVPDRKFILFHKGNIDDDTHGCIIVGEQFEPLGGKDAVLASRKGFQEFLQLLHHDNEFTLHVTDHFSQEVGEYGR